MQSGFIGELQCSRPKLVNGSENRCSFIFDKKYDELRAQPVLGSTEIWHLKTDVSHPIHLHLAPFQVLSQGGPSKAD